jgi:hypothetical protein
MPAIPATGGKTTADPVNAAASSSCGRPPTVGLAHVSSPSDEAGRDVDTPPALQLLPPATP